MQLFLGRVGGERDQVRAELGDLLGQRGECLPERGDRGHVLLQAGRPVFQVVDGIL
ncbi:hypothetical protein ABZV67_43550 [Streptomyces sp. NPDC005065]|uniref:hypothetical protein n=1 Tax=unclassified Streptomyces TaxID=2593676 RepID=UPI0033B61CDC